MPFNPPSVIVTAIIYLSPLILSITNIDTHCVCQRCYGVGFAVNCGRTGGVEKATKVIFRCGFAIVDRRTSYIPCIPAIKRSGRVTNGRSTKTVHIVFESPRDVRQPRFHHRSRRGVSSQIPPVKVRQHIGAQIIRQPFICHPVNRLPVQRQQVLVFRYLCNWLVDNITKCVFT